MFEQPESQFWNYPFANLQILIACLKSFCKRFLGKPLIGSTSPWAVWPEKLKPIRVIESPPWVRISIGPTLNCFRNIISSELMSICCRLEVSLPKSWIMKHGCVPRVRRNSPTLFTSSESLLKRHFIVPKCIRYIFCSVWGEREAYRGI